MEKLCLLVVVLLAVMAASSGSVQKRDTEYAGESAQGYNNYYNYQPPVRRRQSSSPFGWFQNLFRRSSYDDSGYSGSSSSYSAPQPVYHHKPIKSGPSIGDILLPALLVCIGIGLALLAATVFANALNSSGRGLDTDEWEVDHSVWMDQLQKDFEDSWSTQ